MDTGKAGCRCVSGDVWTVLMISWSSCRTADKQNFSPEYEPLYVASNWRNVQKSYCRRHKRTVVCHYETAARGPLDHGGYWIASYILRTQMNPSRIQRLRLLLLRSKNSWKAMFECLSLGLKTGKIWDLTIMLVVRKGICYRVFDTLPGPFDIGKYRWYLVSSNHQMKMPEWWMLVRKKRKRIRYTCTYKLFLE